MLKNKVGVREYFTGTFSDENKEMYFSLLKDIGIIESDNPNIKKDVKDLLGDKTEYGLLVNLQTFGGKYEEVNGDFLYTTFMVSEFLRPTYANKSKFWIFVINLDSERRKKSNDKNTKYYFSFKSKEWYDYLLDNFKTLKYYGCSLDIPVVENFYLTLGFYYDLPTIRKSEHLKPYFDKIPQGEKVMLSFKGRYGELMGSYKKSFLENVVLDYDNKIDFFIFRNGAVLLENIHSDDIEFYSTEDVKTMSQLSYV